MKKGNWSCVSCGGACVGVWVGMLSLRDMRQALLGESRVEPYGTVSGGGPVVYIWWI